MSNIISYRMIQYFGNDVRRINHALKVYGFATCIAKNENLSENELFITDTVAILHDIGIKNAEIKYNSSAGQYQELEGPEVAKSLLTDLNLNPEILERILYIIGNHHSYHKIDGTDFQILVEADFLVNIDEDQFAPSAIESVRKKYFKTKTGIGILDAMFGK